MYRHGITEDTIIYAASCGPLDCEASCTVIGFSPGDVDRRLDQNVRSEQRYAAEQCEIFEDGDYRDAEPEDFPMWTTDAAEFRLGDVFPREGWINPVDWDDLVTALVRYGVADF